MEYKTIRVKFKEQICFIQFYRPEANNCISDLMIEEFYHVLELCEASTTIVVLEGLPEVFCFGADFKGIHDQLETGKDRKHDPERLYDLWLKIAMGQYITISHVKGKVNAGGVGFVAASDIVLADNTAQFSLSELLFGLYPACVLPFLIRRIGFQKAHYLTVMTHPINAKQAYEWGLIDVLDTKSDSLLRKHLIRLRYLSKRGISRYKNYMNKLNGSLLNSKALAVSANIDMFTDTQNLDQIYKFVETGIFPWEG